MFTTESEQLPVLEENITLDERLLLSTEMTTEEVKKHLASLDESIAVGAEQVSPWVLREATQVLTVPQPIVFTESRTRELPS